MHVYSLMGGDFLNSDTAVPFKIFYSVDTEEGGTVQILLSAPKGWLWLCCLIYNTMALQRERELTSILFSGLKQLKKTHTHTTFFKK